MSGGLRGVVGRFRIRRFVLFKQREYELIEYRLGIAARRAGQFNFNGMGAGGKSDVRKADIGLRPVAVVVEIDLIGYPDSRRRRASPSIYRTFRP